MNSVILDKGLASIGGARMVWFREKMPILREIATKTAAEQTFAGKTIAMCMHIEPKTAYWVEGLLGAGAKHIYLVGNLGTTKDDTAAYLASLDRMTVLGKSTDSYEEHKAYIQAVLEHPCDLFLDNGASLILGYGEKERDWMPLGANEETRSGKLLIEKAGVHPAYPVVVIDDSPLKQLLENATGVGQSVVDGFMRATSLLVGGKRILVIGYGYCGSGVATKFKGLGANTMVYDMDPLYMLKAQVDGHQVGELEDLLPLADVVLTVTGCFDVLTAKHIPYLKDGAILANSGHYGFEIDVAGMTAVADSVNPITPLIEKLQFADKTAYILSHAHPLNLAAADGNPIEIMDLGLGLQSLSAMAILSGHPDLHVGLQPVPYAISQEVSRISLRVLG